MTDGAPVPRARPFAVALTGPESTGKSTLAAALARRYGAELSGEAARAYAEARRAALGPDVAPEELLDVGDVEAIARAQVAGEDEAAARAERAGAAVLIRDTDLVSTVVYARHYYGACPSWVVDAAADRRAALYLLCDVDLPWVEDGQRDRPSRREELRDEFARTLAALGCRWSVVAGVGVAREAGAVAVIDEVIAGRASF